MSSLAFKNSLRLKFRNKRKSLKPAKQIVESRKLASQITILNANNAKVAVYASNENEPNLLSTSRWLKQNNCQIFMPIVKGLNRGLVFKRTNCQNWNFLPKNIFGIVEPDKGQTLTIDQLDIVFVPLVAFDQSLNRIGMGGGFYDRTFSTLNEYKVKPLLVGVAHDCQYYDNKLPLESTDYSLDMIITPSKIYC